MAYGKTPPSTQVRSCLDEGLRAHRAGELDHAIAAYRRALVLAPENADGLNLLGTAILQQGNGAEAVQYLERAAEQQRGSAAVLANLAQGYLATGRYREACETFRKASRIAPREPQFHMGMATALALQGRLDEAEAQLTRLTLKFPTVALVWFNLGNVLRDQRRFAAALDAYRKAFELDSSMTEARNAIGSVLHSMLRFAEAEREYRACIEAAPGELTPRYNLASVTMDLGRFDEAELISREIVALAPDLSDAHRLVGTALGHQGRLLEALNWYERAARLAPDDPQNAQTFGAALMEAGHSAAGLRWLSRAAALNPDSVSLQQVTSGALLAHGCVQDAWTGYAYRPAAVELREKYRALNIVQSLSNQEANHICVLAEQGLGDQLFFLRYAALLAARGAHVSCRPARKLYTLLKRVSAFSAVVPEDSDLPPADAYILAGDLPRALSELAASALPDRARSVSKDVHLPELDRRIAVFWPQPARTLEIEPLPERLDELRARLMAYGPPPWIGVTWRGGTAPEKQQTTSWLLYKSIPLPMLAPALGHLPGTVFALQRKPAVGEIEALSHALGRPVHDLTALNDDLEGMLALLALLDEYVGVSNTNMHLRAAAGRTARVFVPAPAEWRWMQSGRTSPWFHGFSIYRQSLEGNWAQAVAELKHDLEKSYCETVIEHAQHI